MTQRQVKIGSFAPGVNNRLEPTQLDVVGADRSRATYLYAGDNVDINEKGYTKRRRGYTQALSGQSHSLWSDGDEAFVVINGNLERLIEGGTGFQRSVVRAGMPKLPLSYSRGADGDVYWSNGAQIRRIAAGVDKPISTDPLPNIPNVTVGAGALSAGQYLVALTVSGSDGESPATPVAVVDVPANGSITVAAGVAANVYVSGPNGDILTLQGTGTSVFVPTVNESGRRCMTLNRAVMPAGQIVRHYRGQLLVATGNLLCASDPWNYGIFNPSKSFIPFPAPITVLEPTDNGLYIAADRTYWIGNLFQDELQELLPYGATLGTSGRSPDSETVYWHSDRGLVIGDKTGAVKNVQEDALLLSRASAGASLFRERDGMTHIVTTRAGAQPNNVAAGTWMEAEVVRKGTTL